MDVIPAIDLLNGQVVRLRKGSYQDVTVYNEDPLDQARIYKTHGFNHIHIVDLNGAKEGTFKNLSIIESIVDKLGMSVQTGGGIRTFEDVKKMFDHGLSKIVCSSMAVKNEQDWLKALSIYGDRCILGMDLKDGKIAYAGWLETLDESTDEFLQRMIDHGLKEVLCTDISRDGTLEGVNAPLYRDLMQNYPDTRFIASGGVADEEDLKRLQSINAHAVVVGRAYYEGKLSLEQMKKYND